MIDKSLISAEAFRISESIRYIAIYDEDGLFMKQREDLKDASSGESDKYEELIVNPTLIKLASQRGNIDCGGLEYFIIRYGHFFVLLYPLKRGHINFGIEPGGQPFSLLEPVSTLLAKHQVNRVKN